jgi:nucleotide-binding universal stress UspA family protein
MFSKILVALDRSELSQQVFAKSLILAQENSAQLMLLHVLSPGEPDYPSFPPGPGIDSYFPNPQSEEALRNYLAWWRTYEQSGLDNLKALCEQAQKAGITPEFTQLLGNPGRMICELANSWGADLIMVGRRGRTGLSEFILGSVSNYVLHHSACAVLTLQPQPAAPAPAA